MLPLLTALCLAVAALIIAGPPIVLMLQGR